MSNSGWISLHRQIQDHWLWKEKPFSRAQAWLDMILLANHRDGKIIVKGSVIEVKKGSLYYSIVSLSKRWGWSRNKIYRYFSALEAEQMIEHSNLIVTSCIQIKNYHSFQMGGTPNGTPSGTADGTLSEHLRNTDNNYNNKNKKTFVEGSDELRLSRLLFELIKERNPNHKEPPFQKWAKEIDSMKRIDQRSFGDIEKIIRWSQEDQFWQNNILCTKTLRNKFDVLVLRAQQNGGVESNKPRELVL